jgi:hypothetical protein
MCGPIVKQPYEHYQNALRLLTVVISEEENKHVLPKTGHEGPERE